MPRVAETYQSEKPCKHGHAPIRLVNGRECAECNRLWSRNWRKKNPDKIRDSVKRWRHANPEKNWALNSRGKLHGGMSGQIYKSLRGGKDGRKWESLVGYSCSELRQHLERQFTRGMTWENYGEWHIDHIVPKSKFEYKTPDDLEFKACWALANLRPLWGIENRRKFNHSTFLV
jgi:5-methylcytosine-specific restriction endonuclease McrA